jgi:subtilisin
MTPTPRRGPGDEERLEAQAVPEAGSSRRVASEAGAPAAASGPGGGSAGTAGHRRYLIGTRALPGQRPFDFQLLVAEVLRKSPDVRIVRELPPPAGPDLDLSLLTGAGPGAPPFALSGRSLVAVMPPRQAQLLQERTPDTLIVEEDFPVYLVDQVLAPVAPAATEPQVTTPWGTGFSLTVKVTDQSDGPVAGAEVRLIGALDQAEALTDANGRATLALPREAPGSVVGLYVKPKFDFWEYWADQPAIVPDRELVVKLTPFSQTWPNFPRQQLVDWGTRALRLDRLPPERSRGRNVRIAIVDSGAAASSHQDLRGRIAGGFDITRDRPNTWSEDLIAHGTHCSAIVGAADDGHGIHGVAPEAELYAYKIFPGGQNDQPGGHYSDLVEALDRAIQQGVDLVNLGLGGLVRGQVGDPLAGTQQLQQRIALAKARGIGCIVGSGNFGLPIASAAGAMVPANLDDVLTVAAIGKLDEYPPETFHRHQALEGSGSPSSGDGYFATRFSCYGPRVDLCAPGVGIVSAVPPNNYAALDGTSMATAYVTGLAALLLAHHPDFQPPNGAFSARNATRVERLFARLRASAEPLDHSDRNRTGAGLPDALKAFSLTVPAGATSRPAGPGAVWSASLDELRGKLGELGLAAGPRLQSETAARRRTASGPNGPGQAGSALEELRGKLAGLGLAGEEQQPATGEPAPTARGRSGSLATGAGPRPAEPERDVRLEELENRLLNVGLGAERTRWRAPSGRPAAESGRPARGGSTTGVESALEELRGKLANLEQRPGGPNRPAGSATSLALDELQAKLAGLGIGRG